MSWSTYIAVSAMFFMEFAVWAHGCRSWPRGCWAH